MTATKVPMGFEKATKELGLAYALMAFENNLPQGFWDGISFDKFRELLLDQSPLSDRLRETVQLKLAERVRHIMETSYDLEVFAEISRQFVFIKDKKLIASVKRKIDEIVRRRLVDAKTAEKLRDIWSVASDCESSLSHEIWEMYTDARVEEASSEEDFKELLQFGVTEKRKEKLAKKKLIFDMARANQPYECEKAWTDFCNLEGREKEQEKMREIGFRKMQELCENVLNATSDLRELCYIYCRVSGTPLSERIKKKHNELFNQALERATSVSACEKLFHDLILISQARSATNKALGLVRDFLEAIQIVKWLAKHRHAQVSWRPAIEKALVLAETPSEVKSFIEAISDGQGLWTEKKVFAPDFKKAAVQKLREIVSRES